MSGAGTTCSCVEQIRELQVRHDQSIFQQTWAALGLAVDLFGLAQRKNWMIPVKESLRHGLKKESARVARWLLQKIGWPGNIGGGLDAKLTTNRLQKLERFAEVECGRDQRVQHDVYANNDEQLHRLHLDLHCANRFNDRVELNAHRTIAIGEWHRSM